jgi:hypothetical protein
MENTLNGNKGIKTEHISVNNAQHEKHFGSSITCTVDGFEQTKKSFNATVPLKQFEFKVLLHNA